MVVLRTMLFDRDLTPILFTVYLVLLSGLLKSDDIPFSLFCACREPPKPVLCSADDCKQVKRYACSSNGLPVCSLSCYKSVLSRSPLASAVAS